MRRRALAVVLVVAIAVMAAGCGASSKSVEPPASRTVRPTLMPMRLCLRRHGYSISPESVSDLRTAPRDFQFVAIWNVLNPNRIALAVTISRSVDGATRAAIWLRKENAKIAKGLVKAPVIRFGKVDVLWTAPPGRLDANGVYGCVRLSS